MARSENEVDQIVFRWDGENASGSTGFGPVAWSASPDEVETVFGIFGAVLRASGDETRPALLRLHQRAGVLLIRRTPWTDPGGRSSVICHALIGSAELLDPATCLGLHGWNWEGSALPLAEVRGTLPVVPARALERAAGPIALQGVESELIGTTAELLRDPKARFTLLDERGDTACPVLWGLHGMFGGLLPDRRWTFASHDTVELPALRFVFVGRWAGAASRNTERRRVDPRERLGDRAEETAARLVHHHLWSLSEAAEHRPPRVADALAAVAGPDDLPLLERAERALTVLDDARARGAGETRRERRPGGAGEKPGGDSGTRAARPAGNPYAGGADRPRGGEARRELREERGPEGVAESGFGDGSRDRGAWPDGAYDRVGGTRGGPESRGGPRSAVPAPGDAYDGGSPRGEARLGVRPGEADDGPGPRATGGTAEVSRPRETWPTGDGYDDGGAPRDGREHRESRVRREASGPGASRPEGLAHGGEPDGRAPREGRAAHHVGDRRDVGPAPAHDPVAVPVVAPAWRGPERAARRRLPRPRGRARTVETGLVQRLAGPVDDAEARVRAGGDGELLDALRRRQTYAVTTLLMGEVARRLPSWDRPLRREFRDLVIGQELFATAPRSTQPGEPGEAERAANAAALHRWAVRPLLDEGDVPAAALAGLLSVLRSSPVPAARSAFRQIVDDERPGLPEDVWRALLREAYSHPHPHPPTARPSPGPPTVSPPAQPSSPPPPPPPPRPAAPPPPSRRPEPPPGGSSGGDGKLVVLTLVAVMVSLLAVIVAYYAT
ncbi:hypothetical protein AB0D99_12300 [Streptomyces sp. NPDC047971]|uniref:hypothetical protein n=1 Tax=Streptomyces sp. NPDC047971 TaxID=3154499 RepID=UPI0033DAFE4E